MGSQLSYPVKSVYTQQVGGLSWSSANGRRSCNEDRARIIHDVTPNRSFLTVLDGHSGRLCVDLFEKLLPDAVARAYTTQSADTQSADGQTGAAAAAAVADDDLIGTPTPPMAHYVDAHTAPLRASSNESELASTPPYDLVDTAATAATKASDATGALANRLAPARIVLALAPVSVACTVPVVEAEDTAHQRANATADALRRLELELLIPRVQVSDLAVQDAKLAGRVVRNVVDLDSLVLRDHLLLKNHNKRPTDKAADKAADADADAADKDVKSENAKEQTDQDKVLYESSGSVGVFAVVNRDESYADVGSVGDASVLLVRRVVGRGGGCLVKRLTEMHTGALPAEAKRIVAAGHFVGQQSRVDGQLAPSRAFGDGQYKRAKHRSPSEQAVCAVPDLVRVRLLPEDVLVLVCDGITDVLTDEKIAQHVLEHGPHATDRLVLSALAHHSTDNVTAACYIHQPANKEASSVSSAKYVLGDWPAAPHNRGGSTGCFASSFRADALLRGCDPALLEHYIAQQCKNDQKSAQPTNSSIATSCIATAAHAAAHADVPGPVCKPEQHDTKEPAVAVAADVPEPVIKKTRYDRKSQRAGVTHGDRDESISAADPVNLSAPASAAATSATGSHRKKKRGHGK